MTAFGGLKRSIRLYLALFGLGFLRQSHLFEILADGGLASTEHSGYPVLGQAVFIEASYPLRLGIPNMVVVIFQKFGSLP